MANFTAADIKVLRERTGAGMLDVRKALEEADGDLDKATEIIRIKGLKGVTKREGRSTSDGLVASHIADGPSGKRGTLIELNCETDFVAKNAKFVDLAEQVLAHVVAQDSTDVAALLSSEVSAGVTLQAFIDETSAMLGEKLALTRVATVDAPVVVAYMHKTNKDLPPQVGVLVGTDPAGEAIASDVAMHIAAYSPKYLDRTEVPDDVVANERRIAEETARAEGKPEAALVKIIEGRMNGFYKDNVLVDQAYARDPKISVGTLVGNAGAQIVAFARFKVGVHE